MSLRGQKGVGIPTVLLHEGEGLIVTVETRAGYSYRGTVETVEDSMNLGLRSVTVVAPDGAESTLDRVFIRGGQVLFVVFPDVLRLAPMFERLRKAAAGLSTAGGLGRGRQAAIEAKGASQSCRVRRRRQRAQMRTCHNNNNKSALFRPFSFSSPARRTRAAASCALPLPQRPSRAPPPAPGAAGRCPARPCSRPWAARA